MNRFWFFFFMIAGVAAVGSFAVAPSMNWWFPGPSRSPLGARIDDLFYLILVITGVTFIGVMGVLGYILWTFGGGEPRARAVYARQPHARSHLEHRSRRGPAVHRALSDGCVGAIPRRRRCSISDALANPVAEVTARQFEWRIRYPAPGKVLQDTPQPDDLYTVNDLHVPAGKPVVIRLQSEDVLHSFFLPHLRIKQDAVPGLVIPVWFQCDKVGEQELVCAELCGWGHYKMRGQLTAQREADFESYLEGTVAVAVRRRRSAAGSRRTESRRSQIAECN